MIRRSGNFGFVDNGAGDIYTFSMGDGGWTPSSFMLRGGHSSFGYKYMNVNGIRIIPFGADNDLPTRVRELLEEFYAGEGIMGKKAGLQWGEGRGFTAMPSTRPTTCFTVPGLSTSRSWMNSKPPTTSSRCTGA